MLKETPKSLRLYFGIIAAFYLLIGIAAIIRTAGTAFSSIYVLQNLVFGALFASITIRFESLLKNSPMFIKGVLTANLVLSLFWFVILLRNGTQPATVIGLVVGLLIYFYLIKTVNRLSKECPE